MPPVSADVLSSVDSRLRMEDCLRQLHVVTPKVKFSSAGMLSQFGLFVPSHVAHWRTWISFPVSKCGTTALRICCPEQIFPQQVPRWRVQRCETKAVRRQARLGAFWSCYSLGFFIRLPLVVWSGIASAARRTSVFVRTYDQRPRFAERQADHSVSERHVAEYSPTFVRRAVHDSALRWSSSRSGLVRRCDVRLLRHLRRLKPKITKIVATHAHEEHVGNLNWLSDLTRAPVYVTELTARFLTPFKKLPWVRATIIGQPPDLKQPYQLLGDSVDTESGVCG